MPHLLRSIAVIACALLMSACTSQAQDAGRTGAEPPPKSGVRDAEAAKKIAPAKPLSADAETPTGERKDKEKDKEKRGNTPPGTDRSGSGPAEGAIVDPAGVTQK